MVYPAINGTRLPKPLPTLQAAADSSESISQVAAGQSTRLRHSLAPVLETSVKDKDPQNGGRP